MKKLLRNKKGFTLVELMIVIAIISILALVLIPKMGFMKAAAREAGTEANMRVVEAQACALIEKGKYKGTGKVAVFEADLAKKLEGKLTNPFTNSTAVGAIDPTKPAPAVCFSENDDGTNDPYSSDTWGDNLEKAKGAAVFAAYYSTEDPEKLKCQVFYYDGDGNKCSEEEKVEVE